MGRLEIRGVALAASLIVAAVSAEAQPKPDAPAGALEPGALDALTSMGAYLRTLKSFQVVAATTDEDVLEDGQKVQYSGTATILARLPNGLRAEVSDDRKERLYFYDGKSSPSSGSGSTTTRRWPRRRRSRSWPTSWTRSTVSASRSRTSSAGDPRAGDRRRHHRRDGPGPSVVQGTTCQHYAYRQADIDWQIWIQKGDYPLPRKLVITTRTDEARPQHTAVYTWNLAPSFNDAAFTFDPPAGAGRSCSPRSPPTARESRSKT